MAAVITIAFDDLINIYQVGNKFGLPVHAPNFDRLADMGMSFNAAYTPVAVCNPARTAAMSGLSQFTTGLHNTNDQQWNDVMTPADTVVGMFQDAGWTTYGSGKVFHNSTGLANAALFEQIYDHHFQSSPRSSPQLDRNPIAEPLDPGETMRDDPNVAWAIDHLDAYDGSEDMLLTLGIIKPHRPFIAPQEFFDLYPQDQLTIPYADGDLGGVSDFYNQYRLLEVYQEYLDTNGLTLDFIQGYLASLSYADAKLGEVLDAIERNSALSDARIVVWSDHGYELGEKQTWNKFTLWEETANIPFVVIDPSIEGGTTNSTPVSLLDLTPTLLEMGGITPPQAANFDGASVLPFADAPDEGRAALTTMFGSLSMRLGEHRFIYYNDGSVELYNVITDPEQLLNLALNPENERFVSDLIARLQVEVAAQGGVFDPNAATLLGTGGGDSLMVVGAQTAAGGAGDDTYLVTEGAAIFEAPGAGYDRVIFSARDFTIPDNVEFAKNSTFYNDPGFTLRGNAQDNMIVAQSTAGTIFALGGNDTVEGSGARDVIDGGAGNDLISGGPGNDTLAGGTGADTIDGGDGWDVATFAATRQALSLRIDADGDVDAEVRNGNNTAALSGVEELQLADGTTFQLDQFYGVTDLSDAQLSKLVELYVAYFNRAPDAVGLHFWADVFAGGTSLTVIANSFYDQPETRALYPDGVGTQGFVEAVYANVLGRTPDAAGLQFWKDVLDRGAVNEGSFVLALLAGARAETGSADDVRYLDDKTDLGTYFGLIRGLDNVGQANTAMALFDGSVESLQSAQAAIDGFYASTLASPEGGLVVEVIGVVDDPFAT